MFNCITYSIIIFSFYFKYAFKNFIANEYFGENIFDSSLPVIMSRFYRRILNFPLSAYFFYMILEE